MLEDTKHLNHLVFDIDENTYAIEVSSIIEVVDNPSLKEIRLALPYIMGELAYKGKKILVVNLLNKLISHNKKVNTSNYKVIVAKVPFCDNYITLGLCVDFVKEIIEFNTDITSSIHMRHSGLVKGLAIHGDKFITILNINKLLSIDEINLLEELVPDFEDKAISSRDN